MYLVIFSSMGPYLYKEYGIRLEHVVIYSIFFIFILNNCILNKLSFKIFLLLILAAFIPLFPEFAFSANNSASQILAGMDNYIIFAITFYVASSFFNKSNNTVFFDVSIFYITLLCINSLISFTSVLVDISDLLSFFHSTTLENIDLNVAPVAVSSSKMNRYTGIFDQPLESGFAYSLGLLLLIFIFKSYSIVKVKFYIYFVLLCIGGILSISKIFIFGGLFFSLIYFFSIAFNLGLTIFILSSVFISSYIALNYSGGFDFFLRLTDLDMFVSNIIFDRYDNNSNIIDEMFNIYNNNFIFGIGYTGRSIFDSGYFQYYYQGGLPQISLQFFLIFIFLYIANFKSKILFLLIFFITILQLLSLLGGPTILANRSPIFLAILYAFVCNHSNVINLIKK